jgi:hypothetical protein
LLFNAAAEIIEKLEQEFREADPQEKRRFIKSSLSLLEQIINDSKSLIDKKY